MTDDLIARLLAFEISDDLGNGDFSLMQEAADALEAAQEAKGQLEEALRGAIGDLLKYQHAAAAGRWSHALKEITGSGVLNAPSKGESQ